MQPKINKEKKKNKKKQSMSVLCYISILVFCMFYCLYFSHLSGLFVTMLCLRPFAASVYGAAAVLLT